MSDLQTVLTAFDSQFGNGAELPPTLASDLAMLRANANVSSQRADTTELKPRGRIEPEPPQNPRTSGGGDGEIQSLGPITVRTFDWGFHLEIPDDTLKAILGSSNAASTLLGIITGVSGPAAPFVAALATFLSIAAGVCQAANVNGMGIFISMLWVAPGVFVPTPVP